MQEIIWFVLCYAEQLETAIRRSLFHYTDGAESEILADEIEQLGDDMFFVAASPTMRKLRAQAELLAQVARRFSSRERMAAARISRRV